METNMKWVIIIRITMDRYDHYIFVFLLLKYCRRAIATMVIHIQNDHLFRGQRRGLYNVLGESGNVIDVTISTKTIVCGMMSRMIRYDVVHRMMMMMLMMVAMIVDVVVLHGHGTDPFVLGSVLGSVAAVVHRCTFLV